MHPAVVLGIFLLQVAVACRVLIHTAGRPAVALAWIVTVMAVPGLGLLAYLLVGESKFGMRRASRHAQILRKVDTPTVHGQRDARAMQHALGAEQRQLSLMAGSVSHSPVLSGNRVALSGDSAANIARMVQDIDAAMHHVHLLTYIYLLDGAGRAIAEALLRAVARGVQVRVLVDDLGSRAFLRSDLRRTLEAAGVQVCGALPTSLVRMVFARLDIRNHRKLLVLDGRVAWVGSQNVAEASFAPKARYAPWVDCMLRVEGPLVRELQIVFVEDWFMEREEDLDAHLAIEPPFHTDGVTAQAVATGPNFRNEQMTLLMQAAVQVARREITLTTPYFVPDMPMHAALAVAARRGVRVRLVVPRRNDSWLVQRASRGLYDMLLEAGVEIHEFTGGLLHAKTVLVDDLVSVITSANLDRRSFELNFEMGVLLYDAGFAHTLRALQERYIAQSTPVELQAWRQRAPGIRLLEGAAGLLSPLL